MLFHLFRGFSDVHPRLAGVACTEAEADAWIYEYAVKRHEELMEDAGKDVKSPIIRINHYSIDDPELTKVSFLREFNLLLPIKYSSIVYQEEDKNAKQLFNITLFTISMFFKYKTMPYYWYKYRHIIAYVEPKHEKTPANEQLSSQEVA